MVFIKDIQLSLVVKFRCITESEVPGKVPLVNNVPMYLLITYVYNSTQVFASQVRLRL